jgi:hypothetical protein
MTEANWPDDLPRPEVVDKIADVMLEAAGESCKAHSASAAELVSAIFTNANKAIDMLTTSSRPEDIEQNKQQLLQALDAMRERVKPKYVM